MKFIDLFAGIGGFRIGMERAGHECVGFCEIDKHAVKSYRAMHDTEGEWFSNDITTVEPNDLPEFDCICGGFPCQSFSIAGKRGGFEDTRGTLFFEVARLIQARKPQYVFLENVKGLLNHDGGRTFGTIIQTLWELGYDCEWQLLNSKNFGVPQNRERVFIVGYPRGRSGRKIFPIRKNGEKANELQGQQATTNTLIARYDGVGNGSYIIEGKQYAQEVNRIAGLYDTEDKKRQAGGIFDKRGISPTLKTSSGGYSEPMVVINEATKKGYAVAHEGDSINLAVPGSETRRGRVGKGIANILDTSCNQATMQNSRIRRLTPKECFRLQGFSDEYFEKAQSVNSDSQLYKQAGNSVTTKVIEAIARRLE